MAALRAHGASYAWLFGACTVAFVGSGLLAGAHADQLQAKNRRFETQAVTDALTGLKNARYFRERLSTECARAERTRRRLALVMVDLDRFKRLNDRFGHAVGDRALVHVAGILTAGLRDGDVACRVGGEELAIICPDCGLDGAIAIAERIRAALVSTPLVLTGGSERVTASFGVASYIPGSGRDALFQVADQALYSAKRRGRNRVEVATTCVGHP